MELGGEAAGVIDIERIAIGEKKQGEGRLKTGIDMVGSFLSYSKIERIAIGGKNR